MTDAELDIVYLLCRRNLNSIDVGAYKGEYTEVMRRYSKFVHGFEPIPDLYHELLKKRFVKGKNVQIHPVALSDAEGKRIINIPRFKNRFNNEYCLEAMASLEDNVHQYFDGKTDAYLGRDRLEIHTRTLDSFNIPDVGLMKIDVEGHELSVLSGARKTIGNYLPTILIEIEERHNPGGHEKVSQFLNDFGYIGCFIYNHDLFPYARFDLEKMQIQPLEKTKHRPISDIPGYVNNFLFFHKSKIFPEMLGE